uniref:Uncharacterized protein n=1 Tax=Schistocephalus solidus TaxID=70667 RepID=A0A0X3NUY6_SCHSO
MDTRFRSPVVPRKTVCVEETAATLAKKSKRSKSSETTPRIQDSVLRLEKRDKEAMNDPIADLNKRWSIIAKTQESMSKQEILNNYRLLMNDHLRLERFLSIVTKDNEMARNRLESDLLDAMMCIEDLKQALEIRMARRRKVDPREAEERRALIRQNKKLLNQLYESAKKIEHLELTKLEMKEQLELLDFQLMEIENQKAIIEEEVRRQLPREDGETQTEEDPETGPAAVAMAKAETANVLSELANQQAESAALLAKHRHLENLLRDLRRDNAELREQIQLRTEDSENSLAESDKHLKSQQLQEELKAKNEIIAELRASVQKHEQVLKELGYTMAESPGDGEGRTPVSGTPLNESILKEGTMLCCRNMKETGLQVAGVRLEASQEERKQQLPNKLDAVSVSTASSGSQTEFDTAQTESSVVVSDNFLAGGVLLSHKTINALAKEIETCYLVVKGDGEGSSASTPTLSTSSIHPEDDILAAIAKLKQELVAWNTVKGLTTGVRLVEETNAEASSTLQQQVPISSSENARLPNSLLAPGLHEGASGDQQSVAVKTTLTGTDTVEALTPEYFCQQFNQLRVSNEIDALRAQLAISEKRRNDLEKRLAEAISEVARAQAESRANDAALTASRRTEAALRRRLLATMDTGLGSRDRSNRPTSTVEFGYIDIGSGSPSKEEFETRANVVRLEAQNAALLEASHLDRVRLQEQATRIAQLEAEHRTLHDRMSHLQASESCAQRASVRLQALYEDMLREFSEAATQDATLRRRRRQQRQTAMENMDYADLTSAQWSDEQDNKNLPPIGLCQSSACAELRRVLSALQERFIKTSELLVEVEAKLATVETYRLKEESGQKSGKQPVVLSNSDTQNTTNPAGLQLIGALKLLLDKKRYDDQKPMEEPTLARNDSEVCFRLLGCLERWIFSRTHRMNLVESMLRQRVIDLQLCLSDKGHAEDASSALQESLNAQKQEIMDLYQKLDQLQDELEVTKACCGGQNVHLYLPPSSSDQAAS